MKKWRNINLKTVVVTGATSGIGNLLVKNLARLGYKIFAGYRNENYRADLQEISDSIIPFYIDMTKKESIAAAAKFICEKTEKIDTLFNVAGSVCAGALECLDVNKIREQFDINTFSHLEFTQGLFSRLEGGKIINISSTSSFGIYPFIAPYCASKRALDMLFNSLELECKSDIRVVSIKPGAIKTPIWEKTISTNKEALGNNLKYQREFEYMVENARKHTDKGLEAQKVVDLIIKIDNMKNPKPSYVVGMDAKIAQVISHLPQGLINRLVKRVFEIKCMF